MEEDRNTIYTISNSENDSPRRSTLATKTKRANLSLAVTKPHTNNHNVCFTPTGGGAVKKSALAFKFDRQLSIESNNGNDTPSALSTPTSTVFDSSEMFQYLSKRKRCQRRLSTLLHTHVILILVCSLSALDAICVIGQLICDILIIKKKLDYFESIDEDLTNVLLRYIPNSNHSIHKAWNLHAILSVLTGSDDHAPDATVKFAPCSNISTVDDDDDDDIHRRVKRASDPKVPGHEVELGILYDLTHVLHLASMVILSLLLLETMLKVFAMGKKLRHHRLEVFDAVVVAISWCLDVAFYEGIWAQPGTVAATFLIYLLPWRVIRIVNSFVLVIQEKDHVQLKIIKQRLRLSVKKSKEFTTKNSFLRHEVKALAGLCRKLGAAEPEITACCPSGKAVKRSSIHSALERAASLTFISTMSSPGSVPSLFDMVESSSDEEEDRSNSALKSTLSNSTQDSGSCAFSVGAETLNHEILDPPSCDSSSNCTSTTLSEGGSPRHIRGLAALIDKESISRSESLDSQPPSYHVATLDNDTRL